MIVIYLTVHPKHLTCILCRSYGWKSFDVGSTIAADSSHAVDNKAGCAVQAFNGQIACQGCCDLDGNDVKRLTEIESHFAFCDHR